MCLGPWRSPGRVFSPAQAHEAAKTIGSAPRPADCPLCVLSSHMRPTSPSHRVSRFILLNGDSLPDLFVTARGGELCARSTADPAAAALPRRASPTAEGLASDPAARISHDLPPSPAQRRPLCSFLLPNPRESRLHGQQAPAMKRKTPRSSARQSLRPKDPCLVPCLTRR